MTKGKTMGFNARQTWVQISCVTLNKLVSLRTILIYKNGDCKNGLHEVVVRIK